MSSVLVPGGPGGVRVIGIVVGWCAARSVFGALCVPKFRVLMARDHKVDNRTAPRRSELVR